MLRICSMAASTSATTDGARPSNGSSSKINFCGAHSARPIASIKPKKIAPELNPGKILQSIDNEELIVKIDGKGIRMLKAEIYFRQLFNKAMKGSLPEARLIAKMAAKYFGPEAEGPSETRFIIVPDKKNKPSRKSKTDKKGKL